MKKDRHPSAERLYEAAALLKTPLLRQADIARALNESDQAVNNWETRATGISAQGCISIQKKLGINAAWLYDGEGDMFVTCAAAAPERPTERAHESPLTSSARSLIEAIAEADKKGMGREALGVLHDMVRLLSQPGQLPDGTADGDDPPR